MWSIASGSRGENLLSCCAACGHSSGLGDEGRGLRGVDFLCCLCCCGDVTSLFGVVGRGDDGGTVRECLCLTGCCNAESEEECGDGGGGGDGGCGDGAGGGDGWVVGETSTSGSGVLVDGSDFFFPVTQ